MRWFSKYDGFKEITKLSSLKIPFLFIVSYNKEKIFVEALDKLSNDILYKVREERNYTPPKKKSIYHLTKNPIDFKTYHQAIQKVLEEIKEGNSYLLNLTFKTPIECDLGLKEIFLHAKAKYKLYYKDEFICFSPESFIDISNATISTYPMKGTIDASLPNATQTILEDKKEMAEHVMIVDLMRNDLSILGSKVKVEKFRYAEKIVAGDKELIQISSKITAELQDNWQDHLGELLDKILPAGSISGTPKKSTVDIIETVEETKREFYTGVFGIYNHETLNSAVMIRFIEKTDNKLYYKSGGGITIDSNPESEYKELIDKIYLPF